MPKVKTRKVVMKRFKLTGTGKLVKKHCNISHLARKDDSSTRGRKKGETSLGVKVTKKVKKMINA